MKKKCFGGSPCRRCAVTGHKCDPPPPRPKTPATRPKRARNVGVKKEQVEEKPTRGDAVAIPRAEPADSRLLRWRLKQARRRRRGKCGKEEGDGEGDEVETGPERQ